MDAQLTLTDPDGSDFNVKERLTQLADYAETARLARRTAEALGHEAEAERVIRRCPKAMRKEMGDFYQDAAKNSRDL